MTDGTRNRNPWLRFGTAVIMALLCVGIAAPVFAQGQYQFSQRNLKKIQKVFEFLQLEGTDEEVDAARGEAKDILLGMNLKRAKPYGRARILCTLGAISVQDGQNEEALDYLERCVAEEALQPEEQLKNLFMVGQLQTMLGNYDDAIVTLESWIAQVETPSPSSYYTLAVTYYQAERAAEALAPAKKAVELSVDTPRESWYRLLLSLHLERQEYDEALVLLDDMILAYPKKAYWSQMAAIYLREEQHGEEPGGSADRQDGRVHHRVQGQDARRPDAHGRRPAASRRRRDEGRARGRLDRAHPGRLPDLLGYPAPVARVGARGRSARQGRRDERGRLALRASRPGEPSARTPAMLAARWTTPSRRAT